MVRRLKKVRMLNKTIDIKTSSRIGEKEYSGICIVHNEKICMLLNFNEETGVYDGFTILRNMDVEFYREWGTEDYAELIHDNSDAFLNELNVSDFHDFKSSLEQLDTKLIAVFIENDLDAYYVGKIESLKGDTLSLRLISKDAEWIDVVELDIEAIWYIGFDSTYEKKLLSLAT